MHSVYVVSHCLLQLLLLLLVLLLLLLLSLVPLPDMSMTADYDGTSCASAGM